MSEQLEEQKPPESNCRDCVHRVRARARRCITPLTLGTIEHLAAPAILEACDRFNTDDMGSQEDAISGCTSYQQVTPDYILSTAATGKWTTLDILSDGAIRFVLPASARAKDVEVSKAWATGLEWCRTADASNIIWGAYVAKQVEPILPSPIAKFPATASYIGEHILRYVLRDGGKALLQRHSRGSGTLYVCVESASHGLLRLLRDTFAGMLKSSMEHYKSAFEFCPQDIDHEIWEPQIAVCVLSRTAAPVIYGALHGLPFPREESVLPDGTRIDTTNRKVFTRELAESFPDPVAKEIALASLAIYEATKRPQ